MSAFDSSIDDFLRRVGSPTFSPRNLDRVWKAFMAYCICVCAEAFERHGFNVTPMNSNPVFVFKCFPPGNPNNYSWFRVERGNLRYELRLSVDSQNLRFPGNALRMNLDVVVVLAGAIDGGGLVDSSRGLVTFAECKNQNAFPELIAGFEGQILELQSDRLWGRWPTDGNPCCLFLTGGGRSATFKNSAFARGSRLIHIYQDFLPGRPVIAEFTTNWPFPLITTQR